MKLKHIIPALFGLSACFACSSTNLVKSNKTTISPQNEDNPISYLRITFDLNGGTYDNLPTFVMENVLPTSYWKYLADNAPGSSEMPIIYPNRNFIGYSLNKDDPTHLIEPSYVVKENITVYAQYEPDVTKDCVVEWYDGSTRLGQPETYVVGETPTFKGTTPIHQGEVFTGWNPVPTQITQAQADAGEIIKYSAVYSPLTQGFTVTLDYNDGSQNIHTQQVNEGEKATEPNIPYIGHHLTGTTGWKYVSGGTGDFSFDTTITQDITIQAQWTVDEYDITYVPNGGTISSSINRATYNGTIATAPTITRDGYDATKVTWWKDQTCTSSQFIFGTSGTKVDGPTTLYAKWGNIKTYTVHFFDDSATPVEYPALKETGIEYGQRAWRPVNDPTKDNYTFDGWYTTTQRTVPFNFSNPLTSSDADINVFAKFTKNQYRVRWLNSDKNHTPLVNPEYYEADAIPTYKGSTPKLNSDDLHRYAFAGFSPIIRPVDDNMTYYANYEYDDEIIVNYSSDCDPIGEEYDVSFTATWGGAFVVAVDNPSMLEQLVNKGGVQISVDGITLPFIGDIIGVDTMYNFVFNFTTSGSEALKNAHVIDIVANMY